MTKAHCRYYQIINTTFLKCQVTVTVGFQIHSIVVEEHYGFTMKCPPTAHVPKAWCLGGGTIKPSCMT